MGQTNGTDTPLSKEQLIIADYTPDDNDNVSSLSLLEHTQSSNITSAAESLGRITIGDKNTNYVGSDHWAASMFSLFYHSVFRVLLFNGLCCYINSQKDYP
jgi:hypothetical protein